MVPQFGPHNRTDSAWHLESESRCERLSLNRRLVVCKFGCLWVGKCQLARSRLHQDWFATQGSAAPQPCRCVPRAALRDYRDCDAHEDLLRWIRFALSAAGMC